MNIKIKYFLAFSLIILPGLSFSKDALPDMFYKWELTSEAYPRTNVYTTPKKVNELCPRKGFVVLGCTIRDDINKTCTVYHWQNPIPPRLDKHEQKHCDGWIHQRLDKQPTIKYDYNSN